MTLQGLPRESVKTVSADRFVALPFEGTSSADQWLSSVLARVSELRTSGWRLDEISWMSSAAVKNVLNDEYCGANRRILALGLYADGDTRVSVRRTRRASAD